MISKNALLILGLVFVLLLSICVYNLNTYTSKPESNLKEEVLLAEASSQLALIYRLRRQCSMVSTSAMFRAMDNIQDRLIVKLSSESVNFSPEGKERLTIVLAAIADSKTYGYGDSIVQNTQELNSHEKALSILADATLGYTKIMNNRQSEKYKKVRRKINVKPKGFYTDNTNGAAERP
ncbi:MAG: hypothetical protein M0P27_07510 [Bacteroidales bacterium]|nr:hypothetical protein [Bacteroidales bacterium]